MTLYTTHYAHIQPLRRLAIICGTTGTVLGPPLLCSGPFGRLLGVVYVPEDAAPVSLVIVASFSALDLGQLTLDLPILLLQLGDLPA